MSGGPGDFQWLVVLILLVPAVSAMLPTCSCVTAVVPHRLWPIFRSRVSRGSPIFSSRGLPGESNLITIAPAAGGGLLVRDDGPPLIAGEHCTGGGREVTCSRIGVETVAWPDGAVGEGDVVVVIEEVHGGRSDHRPTGDEGPNALEDAAGDNRISARGARDAVRVASGSPRCIGEDRLRRGGRLASRGGWIELTAVGHGRTRRRFGLCRFRQSYAR